MFLFKKNKFNSNKYKLSAIERIDSVGKKLNTFGLAKITVRLDKVVNYLDDKSLNISENQAELVSFFIDDIEKHVSRQYESLLVKKCENLLKAIKGEIAYDPQMMVKHKNETRLYEMLGELGGIEEQIRAYDQKMNEALGKDRNLWNMLKAQRQTLVNRAMVLNKNYQSLLESQNALSVAEEVKRGKADAEEMMRQRNMPYMIEFEENADFTALASEDIHDDNERMQTSFEKAFGRIDDSFEYERALEKKLMETDFNFDNMPIRVGMPCGSETN